jgi:hypothetical protein
MSRDEPEDARFEDGAETPLRLRAEDAEDLAVISALAQDAVASVSEIAWTPKRRRFTMLVHRFRWEDAPSAARQRRPFERVQSLLAIAGALRVRASGVDPHDRDTVIAILSLAFTPNADGSGVVRLTLAGDGEIAVEVECLDVTLQDVSRPYAAPSGKAPDHST